MYTGARIIRDGLVLHFDLANIKCFRGEPTVNLKPYPILSHWINSGTCTINQTETDILPPFINNQLSIWSCVVNTTGSIHFGMQSTTILPSTTYTISIWYRQNRVGVSSPYIRTNVNNNSIGSFTYNGSSNSNSWPINTWIRITATATTPSNENGIYLSNYVGSQVGDKIWYYGYQIEQKDHVTAYTSTSRGIMVPTGGGLIDLSNNQNHGELINGVLYDSDNCGSLKFDGVDDYVGLNNINVGNVFTFNCWVKPTTKTRQTIFCNGYPWSSNKGFLIVCPGNSVNGSFISLGADNKGAETRIGLTSNIWQMLTCRVNGSSELIKIYVNGSEVNSYNWQTDADIQLNYDYKNLRIGNRYGPDSSNSNISQVLLYNRALSQSEITQIYNSTKSRYI